MPVQTLWLPKAGHAADEYEDASGASDPETFPFRAAVADGATESAFSGEWARTLVAEYLKRGDLVEAAASARTLFTPALDGRWYVEAKAAEGAHAALLGLEIGREPSGESATDARADSVPELEGASGGDPPSDATRRAVVDDHSHGESPWRAESAGDCCLFHVRGGRLRLSWPLIDAGAFHHRPALVSSRSADTEIETTQGTWRPGDTFVLATDALAAYLLAAGLESLLACTDFERLIAGARRGRAGAVLRNDDATAVIIRL